MDFHRKFSGLSPSIRIAIYYLAFAVAWVLISDNALRDFQTAKGLGFVTISAIGLGYLIHRAWQAREQSERRFRAVVERAGEMISIVDRDGTPFYHSPATREVLGQDPDDMAGQDLLTTVHPDDRTKMRDFMTSMAAKPGTVGWIEFRAFHTDGTMHYLNSTATNLLADPSVQGIVLNTQDVTERKRSERQIKQQFARLQALHEIDIAILESRRLQETLDTVLQHVVEQLEVEAASVLLYNQTSQNLSLARGTGFRDDKIRRFSIPVGEGTAGRTMLSRRPQVIPRVNDSEGVLFRISLMADEGFVGYATIPLIAKDEIKGVLELFSQSPLEPPEDWLVFVNALAAQTAIAIDNARLVENLQEANEQLEAVYDRTLEGWAAALELRDDETEGHSRRVVDLTLRLARALGLDDNELVHIRRGALLHDIGKIGIPDRILLKPGQLDENEWRIMRQHPVYAYDLLKQIPYLHPALDIPRYHHERWDGSGYPEGLSGKQIPLYARIFAVVDVYDALTSDRPYRPAWSRHDALEYIRDEAGRQFDPSVCAAFLALMDAPSRSPPVSQQLNPARRR